MKLTSMLSAGPHIGPSAAGGVSDPDLWVDLVRRLHVPGYERIRARMGTQELAERLDGYGGSAPYLQDTLDELTNEGLI